MDMQNVSSLQIPEGVVRTIHDKDGKLLWGRLAYDTKYAGDTLQNGTPTPDTPVAIQTVTGEQAVTIGDGVSSQPYKINLVGKNLFDITTLNKGSVVVTDNIATGTATQFNSAFGANTDGIIVPVPNEQVTISATGYTDGNSSTSNVAGLIIRAIYSDNTNSTVNWNNSDTTPTVKTLTTTAGKTISKIIISYQNTGANTWHLSNFQIEVGDTATEYVPYFTPIELCKIGTYQDYIHKSGDDWYVHKATGKYTFDGNEAFSKSGYSTTDAWVMYWATTSLGIDVNVDNGYCEFGTVRYLNRMGATLNGVVFNNTTGSTFVKMQKSMITNWDESATDSAKVDLAKNMITGKSFYYVLATPTDTKITDSTLIGQLNAVHQWLTRHGYNATVSGNLPIIIDRTNL